MSLVHHRTHYMPMTTLPLEEAYVLHKEITAYLADSASQALFPAERECFIIDTGASITITNCASDYVVPPKKVHPTHLQGIASGLSVQGIGTAIYHFRDDKRAKICLELNNVLFMPDCPVQLLCSRHIAENTIPAAPTCYIASNVELSPMPVVGISANLSPSQRTKLILHERCNHINFETINRWIRKGVPPIDKSVANSEDPICAACQIGKANKRAHKADVGSVTAKHTAPGQGVSVDLLEAGIPGRLPTTRGLPSPKRYRYVTLWVDHYSRYLYPTFHETKDLNAALASKREFEAFANKFGVKIASIRADNGVYAANGFQSDCDEKGQPLTFCAMGGHWQNGVIERAIGVITRTARTILLHAMSRWPGTVTEEFWPFAVRHACTFHNASVRSDTGLSPHHMFTGELAPWKLEDFRVFGSPAYVLAKRLQDGDSLPKCS
jgi:hypothetical protein